MDKRSIGRYRILRLVASGGMADVYKAVMTGPHKFEKQVALKMIHERLTHDMAFRSMFIDEARISARFMHPNIVQVIDFGETEGRLYQAMEYVHGVDLKTYITALGGSSNGPQIETAVYVITKVLEAVDYTYRLKERDGCALGVVHRDITPHNILLSYDGDVKLTDFGIAKMRGSASATIAGTLKGKLRYMSPEQARGEMLDHRSDLYTVALVLYELITHRKAYAGETDMILLRQVQSAHIESPPSRINPSVPQQLEDVVLKALSPGKHDRFPDPASFKRALECCLPEHVLSRTVLSASLKTLFIERTPKETDRGVSCPLTGRHVHPVHARSPVPVIRYAVFLFAGLSLLFVPGNGDDLRQIQPLVQKGVQTNPVSVSAPADAGNLYSEPRRTKSVQRRNAAPAGSAMLTINAVPWAEVYSTHHGRKRYVGSTPLRHVRVPAGSCTLVFKNSLYGTKTVTFRISSGEHKTVVLKYDRTTGQFTRVLR